MQYLQCGKLSIPLVYVQGVSTTKRAKTAAKPDGRKKFIGFEPVEISVRAVFNVGIAQANDRDLRGDYILFDSINPDRLDEPATCYIGGYPIIPDLQFAITSVNKSRIYDPAFDPSIELDIVLAGVKISKEQSRNRAMDFQDVEPVEMPEIILNCDDKDLQLKAAYGISEFKSTPDSCNLTIAISDDLSVAQQPSFLEALLRREGTIHIKYPTGLVKYWIADASLQDNILTVSGTVLPPNVLRTYVKTHWARTIQYILKDLCNQMGVQCDYKGSGFVVDYYQSRTTPIDAVKELVSASGLLLTWSGNKCVIVEPPETVSPKYTLEAYTTPDDTGQSLYMGCDWRDGINRSTTGDMQGEVVHVIAPYRCSSVVPARLCLRAARQSQRVAVVESAIVQGIVHGSAVNINSNGTLKPGFVSNFEYDWLEGAARYEISLV